MSAAKTGVLLLNLGGPNKPEDVEPFLCNLFSDREIIRLGPAFLQPFIAKMIARRRAPKSRANYARMEGFGGGSPIMLRTLAQCRALEALLGPDCIVRPCMRYWHPFADEALQEMRDASVERIVALSLYPHYSVATTGSSLNDLARTMQKAGMDMPLVQVRAWPDAPEYVAALAERVKEGLAGFAGKGETRLLYSAHSLPKKFVDEGDPYVDDLRKTIAALETITQERGEICYQSRSGPVEWLAPSTPDAIKEAAMDGVKNLVVLPISFVSDHIETLVELDMDYRKLAQDLGMGYAVTRPLNDDPLFMDGLARLVQEALAAR